MSLGAIKKNVQNCGREVHAGKAKFAAKLTIVTKRELTKTQYGACYVSLA